MKQMQFKVNSSIGKRSEMTKPILKQMIVFLFVVCGLNAKAGNFVRYGGASAAGLGQSVVAYSKAGYFQNQALITRFDSIYIELYSAIPFAITEFGTHSVFVAAPLLGGVTSFQYQYFGYQSYNENKTGVAYARKLGKGLSIGVQLSWLRVFIPEPYQTSNNLLAEVGLSYELNKYLNFGAHIFNPTLSKPVQDESENPETAIRVGVSYRPIEVVACNIELVQWLNHKTSFRVGIDLQLTNALSIQTGYNHDSQMVGVGIGLDYKSFVFAFAGNYHNVLGYSPHLSIGKHF
ncbi:MAG: hypothetical protein PHW19_09230 [Salinivirgaceae bacterium]|nr:hypothetical protein [Salinivirgaceae bacterium]